MEIGPVKKANGSLTLPLTSSFVERLMIVIFIEDQGELVEERQQRVDLQQSGFARPEPPSCGWALAYFDGKRRARAADAGSRPIDLHDLLGKRRPF